MRYCNRGEDLTKDELFELANNTRTIGHSRQRFIERKSDMVDFLETLKSPYLAYFNTDYSINICKNEHQCFIVDRDKFNDGCFVIITYKENTHCPMSKKRMLAVLGIDR